MRIYFDESGQSGCVLQKADLLNFQKQPTFAIGAVVIRNDADLKKMSNKYNEFKQKYKIDGEIKGKDLLTKANNEKLEYILKNILDRTHFFVLLYDKRFYISTLLLLSLLGFEYQHLMPEHFYQQATFLSLQKDDFFVEYLKYIQNPGKKKFSEYLSFLINYKYIYFESPINAVVEMAQSIVREQIEDKCYDDFMTFGWYDNPNVTNLINLTALSELIFFIKSQVGECNDEILYIHDHIKEFENTFTSELQNHGINLTFADSKDEPLLQLADNVVSILRHAYDKGIMHIKNNEQWLDKNEWDMKLLSRTIIKLSHQHISFTVPLCDWAAALCTEIMFSPKYKKKYRNNIYFNYYYMQNMLTIFESIRLNNHAVEDAIKLLEL